MKKKLFFGLLTLLIIIQFIRPGRNTQEFRTLDDISLNYLVPDQVHNILKQSCYDCHSNNTRYPWYANVQPFGWWLQSHINDAKKELNFSEFGTYPEKKAKHKFEEIEDEIREHAMPLNSYLLLHSDARLSSQQSDALIIWAGNLKK